MAHHGGRTSLPHAHRPRAPIMSAPAPLTAPLAPLRPPPPVTLTAPRPEIERATNEYVETPIRPAVPSPPPQPPRLHRPERFAVPLPPLPVTKQPATATFSKDHHHHHHDGHTKPSIMCAGCGRCRCRWCQQPLPLPSRWICNNQCFCSADACIDYVSCLCCVKGLFYHCSDSDGGSSCADDPCGCTPDKRTARWGCLAALSFVLPCLWLYWPLQCCKSAVEVCYSRRSSKGCDCPPLATPEKRLLENNSPDL